jgi:hypothetical protein
VVDHIGRRQALEGAPPRPRDLGMGPGHAADVGLVDHRFGPGPERPHMLAPGEGGVDHAAFRHAEAVVAPVEGQVGAVRPDPIAEMGIRPAYGAAQRLGIGVDQQLVGIEAVTVARLVGAMDAVAVEQPGHGLGQIAVPHLVGVFGQRDAVDLAPAAGVEQAQLDPLGVGGEQREVDARAVPGCAERRGAARLRRGSRARILPEVVEPSSSPPGAQRNSRQRAGSRTIVPAAEA